MRQMTSEWQSDMEVRMKQRCVIEFLQVEKKQVALIMLIIALQSDVSTSFNM